MPDATRSPTPSTPTRLAAVGDPAYDRRAGHRLALEGEQLAAVRAREHTVALSAGAGSGKTTVLVERFLDLVLSDGVSPLGILAITFTERAAAEMKERIVRRFEERGDDANRRRADSAYISTIHGFCARLLRENPLAAGVDIAFDVVDDLRLGLFLDEELERLYADEWFLSVMDTLPKRFGSDRPRLFELICDCVFGAREFGKGVAAEEGFTVEEHVAAAMRRLDAYCRAEWAGACEALAIIGDEVRGLAVSGPARMKAHQRLCELLTELAEIDAVDPAWARAFCEVTSFTAGVKDVEARAAIKRVLDPARATIKALADFDRAAQEELERESIAPLKAGIHARARELRGRYEQFKLQQSLLDFEDLQRIALRLLDRPEVRAEYADRFRHVLLDEAQDTNEVQKAIVDKLRGGDGQELFAVGDVKQAIYGFRGADVTLFQGIHRDAGAGRLSLRDNYRSRPQILDFVNAAGRALWADGSLEFEELLPKLDYRPSAGATPHVELLLVEKLKVVDPRTGKERTEEGDVLREREALAIADRVRRMVEGGEGSPPLEVYDKSAKSYRAARYGDVAVLCSRRTHFAVYERAFWDLGVPVVADGGRGFFSGREIQDVLNALRAVANPLDDVALVAALRSPLFGWSDADLVRLRLAAGRRALWRAVAGGFVPVGESADPHAHDVIETLRRLAPMLAPASLVTALLQRTAYEASLLRTPRGRAAVANLTKLVEFARRSGEVDGPSLRRFLHRAELAQHHLAREQDAPVAAEGDDVVLLGTIHGAKGLEWPVVVLAGLDADFARADSGSFYAAEDGLLVVEPLDEEGDALKPTSHRPVRALQKARDEQEARRLFYVALTRTREHLQLSGPVSFPEKPRNVTAFGTPVEWLADRLGVTAASGGSGELTFDGAAVRVTHVRESDAVAVRETRVRAEDARLAEARRLVARGEPVLWTGASPGVPESVEAVVDAVLARPPLALPASGAIAQTTVTQLVYFFRCPMVYYLDLVLQVEEHPRGRRKASSSDRRLSAVELGTEVHEALELADLGAEPGAEATRLAAQREVPEADRAHVERMLRTVLADPLLGRARGARRLEREYQFYLGVGGTIVQGVIDLVFEDEQGRGVVVDYKSNDLAAPDRVNVLTRHYRPQIELYALAASKAGLVEPSEATLYFLNRGIPRTHTIDERRLAVVEEEASDVLSRISRRAWDTEPGEKCRGCGYRKRGICEVGKRWVG